MKKEDIELLKLAARAIGEIGEPLNSTEFGLYKPAPGVMQPYVSWNPLTNDSDNHRMETHLKLEVRWHEDGVEVGCRDKPFSVFCFFAEHNNDENAARRRASTEMASKL